MMTIVVGLLSARDLLKCRMDVGILVSSAMELVMAGANKLQKITHSTKVTGLMIASRDGAEPSMQMERSTKASGKTGKEMGRESTLRVMALRIPENGSKIRSMDLGYSDGLIIPHTKVITSTGTNMVEAFSDGQTALTTKEISRKTPEADKENCTWRMVRTTRVHGETTRCME